MDKVITDYLQLIRRMRRFIWGERKIISLIFIYAIINGIIVLVLPLGIQAILNYVLGGRITSSWFILIVIVMIGLTVSGLIQITQMSLTEKLQQRIFAKSSFEIAVRLPKIKIEAFQNDYAPEVVNRFFDTVNLQKGLTKLLVDFPTATLQIFFGMVLISVYHPFFLFFSLFVVAILYLVFRYTGPAGLLTSLKESTHKYEVAHWLEELARTMGTFKLAGITKLPLLKIDALITSYLSFRRKHFAILITQFKIMVAFKVLTIGVLLVVGSLLLIDNQISLGQFVAAEIIVILIMNSIEKIIVGLETVYDVLTSVEKLGSITDLPLEDEIPNQAVLDKSLDGFSLRAVQLGFRYPGSDKTVIRSVDLAVDAGSKIALAGLPGSGKATLLQLLSGLYEIYDGRILYNDIPLTALRHDQLRLEIGDNIWQETLFKGTLRENISLGKEHVTDEMINEAIVAVGASDGINQLQDRLNTILFPGGIKLPKSLVGKLILARSIVSKPKLLLLDLENLTLTNAERQTFYAYLFARAWTVVAISRDPEYLKRAARILFMEAGGISFNGNYTSFNNSPYA